MNSLNNTYLTLDSNGLGEIREVRLYSGNNTLFGTLRKASDSITGNNEFFEYICRYFGLRQEYSQDLLLNSIISDLSGYTIEDLEVFEKYAVPVSSSEETSLYTKYFGTVNINERSITPLLVPSGVKTLKIVDTSGEERLEIKLTDYVNFDKVVLIVVDQTSPNSLLVVNLPAKSWSTSKEPERWLKYKYARNDEKQKTIEAIKTNGALVFDVLSGNILGTVLLENTPLLNKRLEKKVWNPNDFYKLGELERWKNNEWFSLAPDNRSKNNPMLSPLWDENPKNILNKRVRIICDPLEVENISPNKFIIVNSEKDVRFSVKVVDGYILTREGITPEIVGSFEKEVGNSRYFFTVHVTTDTEAIIIKATKSYIGKIDKVNETTLSGETTTSLEDPIVAENLYDGSDNFTGFKFDLSSYPDRDKIVGLKRGDVSIQESTPGSYIYIDNSSSFDLGTVYKYTLLLNNNYYKVHVTVGDKLFEIDEVYQIVSENGSATIRFYKIDGLNKSWPSISINEQVINTEQEGVNYTGFRIEGLDNSNQIFTINITNITEDLNIQIS